MGNNSKKSIVYLTINIKNHKIYIGVHDTDHPYEFDGYLGCGVSINKKLLHPKTPFEYAVKKYGYASFKRITLFVYDNRDEALQMERFIVNEEFIARSDTYNIALGGGNPPRTDKIVYQYDLNGLFIKKYNSITEASKILKIKSSDIISKAVLYKTVSCGCY